MYIQEHSLMGRMCTYNVSSFIPSWTVSLLPVYQEPVTRSSLTAWQSQTKMVCSHSQPSLLDSTHWSVPSSDSCGHPTLLPLYNHGGGASFLLPPRVYFVKTGIQCVLFSIPLSMRERAHHPPTPIRLYPSIMCAPSSPKLST